MDAFDKRLIFYFVLMIGLVYFFMIPYSDGIHYWEDIYEDTQESIYEAQTDLLKIRGIKTKDYYCEYYYYFSWEVMDGVFIHKEDKPHYCHYIACFKIDSAWFEGFPGFDTILVIKKYSNHEDTIKIALLEGL